MSNHPFKGGQGRDSRCIHDTVDALSTILAIALVAAVVGVALMIVS